jgi:uncharacterized membrane protein
MTMTIGPVQVLVVGFEGKREFTGEILEELHRLREHDIVRLIDLMAVRKDADGNVEALQVSDLSEEEASEFGAVVGALIGFGAGGEEGAEAGALAGAAALEDRHALDEEQVWYVADEIPNDSTAAVALLEHRWAIPLRDKILDASGTVFADEWVHPSDLVAVGLAADGSS